MKCNYCEGECTPEDSIKAVTLIVHRPYLIHLNPTRVERMMPGMEEATDWTTWHFVKSEERGVPIHRNCVVAFSARILNEFEKL